MKLTLSSGIFSLIILRGMTSGNDDLAFWFNHLFGGKGKSLCDRVHGLSDADTFKGCPGRKGCQRVEGAETIAAV